MKSFSIGNIEAKPGTKVSGFLPSAGLATPDGTGNYWNIPVIIVNGLEAGPVFEVDGCIHGEEQQGAYTVLELAKRLDPKKLKGTFIGIPVLNVPGFRIFNGIRGCIQDIQYIDMNRQFPGDPRSWSVTRRAVHTFWNEILLKCDYTVNLHGCMINQIPRVIINEDMPETLEMAKAIAYSRDWVIAGKSEHTKLKECTINWACTGKNIPNVLIESGSSNREYGAIMKDAEVVISGIENCMRKYGMLDGEVKVPASWRKLEYYTHVRGGASGIMYPEPCFRMNNMVRKGDLLCRIVDLVGNEIEQVRAPHDGIVLSEVAHVSTGPESFITMIGYQPVDIK